MPPTRTGRDIERPNIDLQFPGYGIDPSGEFEVDQPGAGFGDGGLVDAPTPARPGRPGRGRNFISRGLRGLADRLLRG